MVFTQSFAIPCLLFRALADLDLGAVFDPRLLLSFYAGAVVSFALGILGARKLFHHRPGEAVAIGFSALFSNSVLLGLPIMAHAYGQDALAPSFAIVSIHAPFCTSSASPRWSSPAPTAAASPTRSRIVARTIIRNGLMIGLAIGFAVNLGDIPIPGPVRTALDMMADTALPARSSASAAS